MKIDGTDFKILHTFGASTNLDGAAPNDGLVLSGTTLYGTTSGGGSANNGTVFSLNIDGTGFAILHDFSAGIGTTNSEGISPKTGLVFSGDTLYGTASSGGPYGQGTIFAIKTNSAGFSVMHSFTGQDGWNPRYLTLSGNTLYGRTYGSDGFYGTLFKLSTDGTGFTGLPSYGGLVVDARGPLTVFSDKIFAGSGPGKWYSGSIASLSTNGAGGAFIYDFSRGFTTGTNSDGYLPQSGLVLSGDLLYGTTESGGWSGMGTLYTVKTNGTGFTLLHTFSGSGGGPSPTMILSGNTLYGSTTNGVVFRYSLFAQLDISRTGDRIVLSWLTPTDSAGSFVPEACTNLGSPVWTTNLPAPNIVKGLSIVTNPISGIDQFFRLHQVNPVVVTFTNLDFSAANWGGVSSMQNLPADQVIPGWNASDLIWVNQLLPRWHLMLNAGQWGEGNYFMAMQQNSWISQSNYVIPDTKSLRFAVSDPAALVVSLNGQTLTCTPLYSTNNYVKCAADISSFAGTTAELRFTPPSGPVNLNGISFSTELAP
jgi:uncharacterized repeat protein (TIGR03803 family)